MEEPNPLSPIETALEIFMQHYIPAADQADADELMTTADIADYLSELISLEDINNTAIFDILTQNGYKVRFTNGFTWLLKMK